MKKKTKSIQTKKTSIKSTKVPVKKISNNSKPVEKENKKAKQEHPMSTNKKYTGTLTLEWYNKQKSILVDKEENKSSSDVPAPKINWVNRENSLFYEIMDENNKDRSPTWVNMNDIRVKENRSLDLKKCFVAEKVTSKTGVSEYKINSSADLESNCENILIKGDNLLALNSLKKQFATRPESEKAKCIYIDPPYNTGAAFDNYDDNLEHSEWLTLMRDRLILLKDLLQVGGFIFVQLDDSEGPYGKILLDDIFGRENFIITMYIQVRYNDKTLKEDMIFNKLIEQVHIYRKGEGITNGINRKEVEYTEEKFCIEIKEIAAPTKSIKIGGKKVDIFENGKYEIIEKAPSKKGLKEIWASGTVLDGNSSGRFFRDYLTGREEIDGLKTLYKVYGIGDDGLGYRYFTGPQRALATRGKYYQGMPLDKQNTETSYKFVPISNFIDLASSVGNCRHEGGVEFKSGKKPEILISKLLELASSPGDLIIDCFAGSGTTLAVAHKMSRKWIGIEVGNHADSHIITRLKSVIDGTDQTGVSAEYEWKGGGSFKYYHLGPSIISNKKGEKDFNWKLGKKTIEESLLSSYDYVQDLEFEFSKNNLFKNEDSRPAIGVQKLGSKTRVAIISLHSPDEKSTGISFEEISSLYELVKSKYGPEYINIFTNRGVDISSDSRPEDLEIIKVPHAIFAELEK